MKFVILLLRWKDSIFPIFVAEQPNVSRKLNRLLNTFYLIKKNILKLFQDKSNITMEKCLLCKFSSNEKIVSGRLLDFDLNFKKSGKTLPSFIYENHRVLLIFPRELV
jgi:hypothetical protein